MSHWAFSAAGRVDICSRASEVQSRVANSTIEPGRSKHAVIRVFDNIFRWIFSTPILVIILCVVAFFVWLGSWKTEFALEMLAGERPEVTWPQFAKIAWESRVVRRREEADACATLWETKVGEFWAASQDRDLLDFLIIEQTVAGVYHRDPVAVRPGDIVLDVGSHLGVFTRLALSRGARTVVAIEPAPKNLACYKKTFANEIAAGKVILVEAAAWNEPTTLHFEVDEGYHGSARGHVTADGKLAVKAVTIDNEVEQLGLDSVDFIKMDIEGAERFALRGAAQTISRFRPRMAICVYHGGGSSSRNPARLRCRFNTICRVLPLGLFRCSAGPEIGLGRRTRAFFEAALNRLRRPDERAICSTGARYIQAPHCQ